MSSVSSINQILNAKSTGMFLFGITGAYKVLTDYKNAPQEEKKSVLLRDSAILAGSAAGMIAYSSNRNSFLKSNIRKISSQFLDNKLEKLKTTKVWKNINSSAVQHLKKPAEIIVKNAYNIGKDCLDNVLMVASGITGAIATDYLLQIGHRHKQILDTKLEDESGICITKEKHKLSETESINVDENSHFNQFKDKIMNNSITNEFDSIVGEDAKKNILSNITNMPEMKLFNSTMIGLQSFQIAEEKTFKDKLRHTTRNLITNTLVPMFYLSLASNVTKGIKKNFLRVPLVFASMVVGTMYTNKKLEKHINM
ncbi:MAG: hypothetical protein ACI4S3_05070 [Candidatus Gastranaerophilaceae bacterium]